ncbi:hypothetical protein, partial [Tannerella forsythia]|uniref:hypothetical protein n=1 Tax=Tannerella forsythia TaxID=28112 RepID=UPI003C788E01
IKSSRFYTGQIKTQGRRSVFCPLLCVFLATILLSWRKKIHKNNYEQKGKLSRNVKNPTKYVLEER